MKKYTQISKSERLEISILLEKGYSIRSIAKVMDRPPSTISREIERNKKKKTDVYDPFYAEQKTRTRRKNSKYQGMKIWGDNDLREYIEDKMKLGWSPDVISGRMKIDNLSFYVSKTSIYDFIYSAYGQYLDKYLYSKQERKKRRQKKLKKEYIKDRTCIEKRPPTIEERRYLGHYEADTIVSGKRYGSSSLSVLIDRKSRFVEIQKLNSLKPEENRLAIESMISNLNRVKSITFDNGFENRYHFKLGIPTYFCHPYSSWEKGGVENVNRLIRRYIKKGSDISMYSEEYIEEIKNKLNNTPRKILGYKTPFEIMYENKQFKSQNTKKQHQGVAVRG